jgi:hypothetical protein
MHTIVHALFSMESVLALLITAGAAVLLFSCVSCSDCKCREKDEIFRRKSV